VNLVDLSNVILRLPLKVAEQLPHSVVILRLILQIDLAMVELEVTTSRLTIAIGIETLSTATSASSLI